LSAAGRGNWPRSDEISDRFGQRGVPSACCVGGEAPGAAEAGRVAKRAAM